MTTTDDLERLAAQITRGGTVDEDWYLMTYPDVAKAVREGALPSARSHYVSHGHSEGRKPAPETAPDPDRLLVRKSLLEAAMQVAPRDYPTRNEYFDVLMGLARSRLGVFAANLPDVATPLLFRAGTSDILNMRQIFLHNFPGRGGYLYGDYGWDLPNQPRRILDLGAYVGYVAVYLLNRFPDAAIVCVEPPGGNFSILQANLAAYPRARCIPGAVWDRRLQVRAGTQVLGDWGNQFEPATEAESEGLIEAYPIPDLLRMAGWAGADFIKSTVENAPALFCEDQNWMAHAYTVVTKLWRGPAGSEDRAWQMFQAHRFMPVRLGEALLFSRPSPSEAPLTAYLVPTLPQVHPLRLSDNLADYARFYATGPHDLKWDLSTAAGAAGTSLEMRFAGQSHFSTILESGPIESSGAIVTLRVLDAAETTVAQSQKAIAGGVATPWTCEAPAPLAGVHTVALKLTPNEGAAGWIRLHDPRFT